MSENQGVTLRNYEKQFINKVLLSVENYSSLARLGFNKNLLKQTSTQKAFDFIYEAQKESNGAIPTPTYIMNKLTDLSKIDKEIKPWEIVEEQLSIEVLIKELRENHIKLGINDLRDQIGESLTKGEPTGNIMNFLRRSIASIDFESTTEEDVLKVTDVEKRIRLYEEKKESGDFSKGLIRFPFPKLNTFYSGIGKKDLIFLMAPQKSGKTFVLNEFAMAGFNQRKKVLYISPEMSSDEVLQRIDGFMLRTDYRKVRECSLTDDQLNQYKAKAKEFQAIRDEGGEIYFIDNASGGFTIDFIKGQADFYKPDIILIDGLTLLGSADESSNDWLEIKKLSQRLKGEICNGMKIPIVCCIQSQNSEQHLNKDILTSADIGRSKLIAQDADIIFGLSKSTENGKDKRVFNTTDVRRGPKVIVGIRFDIEKGTVEEDEKLTEKLVKENKADFE